MIRHCCGNHKTIQQALSQASYRTADPEHFEVGSYVVVSIYLSAARSLTENSDRREVESDLVRLFAHLRRIVVLFHENERKIWPVRPGRSRSVYSRPGSQ